MKTRPLAWTRARWAVLAVAFAVLAAVARAELIIDTGAASTGVPGLSLYNRPDIGFQFLAGQFTIVQKARVTGIQGWIATLRPGQLDISVYDSSGPATRSLLFSDSFAATQGDSFSIDARWQGLTGENWVLDPAQYWVVFSPALGGMEGFMPTPVPHPLAAYQAYSTESGRWSGISGVNSVFGVRVYASPVPEAQTLGVFAAVLLLLLAGVHRLRTSWPVTSR